jgi:predicted nucleic acid-binding protein
VGAIVLDASVLIGYLDPGDAHHRAARTALVEREGTALVLPASAYAEVLVYPLRRGEHSIVRSIDRFIAAVPVRVEPIGREIAREAARLRAGRRSLRLPDALVVATGEVIVADEILTADRALRGVSPRVTAIV